MELILDHGAWVSVILGTASGSQNVGVVARFGSAPTIALAGLVGSPISGASMNPARTFGPDLPRPLHQLRSTISRADRRLRASFGIAFVLAAAAAEVRRRGCPG